VNCIKTVLMASLLALLSFTLGWSQSARPEFEVATIKPTAPDDRSGRFITIKGGHQFVAKSYTLKFMVAAAYNLPPRTISGGPAWIDLDRYDIVAVTPGEVRPNLDEQMAMLRTLLADRFKLTFHTEAKELPVYVLTVARSESKLKESPTPPDELPALINTVFPGDRIVLPARNATMAQFASMMQRAVLDRPVLDKTGLPGRYDFDLEWTPDDTQFGGNLPPIMPENSGKPDLFAAIQQQLGLRLEPSKATVEVITIDGAQKPTEN
jgi:uncharacterized protein (TIGR03435 family)